MTKPLHALLFNACVVSSILSPFNLECLPAFTKEEDRGENFPQPDFNMQTSHSLSNVQSIILMQNFDSFEWRHVHINRDKMNDLANQFMEKDHLKIANWGEILPLGLGLKECVEYLMGLICIDFCHWDLKPGEEKQIRNFYTKDESGMNVRGSAAMTALAKMAYHHGVKIFDAACMNQATVNDLRPHLMGVDHEGHPMEIPWLEERVKVLNQAGRILIEKWEGSFYNLLCEAKARAFNQGLGFVELLVRDFPRFRDEYLYKGKKIGIYKLAQLAVMALQSALAERKDFSSFTDCDALTLCADYQLPRSLRAFEILEYDSELQAKIDLQELLPHGSDLEIELRMATVYAGHELKKIINTRLADQKKPPITSLELDYLLWRVGRELDPTIHKHHLTRTMMY